MSVYLVNDRKDTVKEYDSRAEAEDQRDKLIELGMDSQNIEIKTEKQLNEDLAEPEPKSDGGTEVVEQATETQTVEHEPEPVAEPQTDSVDRGDGLEQLGEQLDTDPLDVLPGYMITTVDGKPSLNKRGVSVLAYHYDITVTDKETVAYPHETEYTSAIVEITVEGKDGRVFVGAGEAHVDETPKHQLLRMAETRAYKRAVIFATGTGIVGYQEIMEQLQ